MKPSLGIKTRFKPISLEVNLQSWSRGFRVEFLIIVRWMITPPRIMIKMMPAPSINSSVSPDSSNGLAFWAVGVGDDSAWAGTEWTGRLKPVNSTTSSRLPRRIMVRVLFDKDFIRVFFLPRGLLYLNPDCGHECLKPGILGRVYSCLST